jgi:hemerythrin
MPIFSRFFGIVVFMNYNDHNPPHFHARYQAQEVIIEIQSGKVTGSMSRRALQMLFEWMEQHQEELMANWSRARERKALLPIPPLA